MGKDSDKNHGGPAGYSHLPKVAVPQKMDEPRFKGGLNNKGMTTNRRAKDLLKDEEVATWHANLKEGSEITAYTYLRRLNNFCDEFETTPQALAAMNSKDAYRMLVNAVQHYRSREPKLTGSTIKGYIKAIRSWLQHNEVVITQKVRIVGANSTPTLKGEQTPEPYVLHSVWKFCDERQAALISLAAFLGFRPQVFGSYRGDDGLRLEDLPELQVDNDHKKVLFQVIPTRVIVREERSKTRRTYEGFLCREGCERLEKYLVKRMNAGEELVPHSAIIADDFGAGRNITTKSIGKLIRKVFRHAGFPWRPLILRRYYDTRLGQAVAKPEIGLLEEWVTFWMGHLGDIEAHYRLHKKLSDSLLEQMREAYRRASESMLQTVELHRNDASKIRRELRAMTLSLAGFADEEVKGLDLDKSTTKELQRLIKEKLSLNANNCMNGNGHRQLVVAPDQAKHYINEQGWQYKGSMPTGEVVIESP